MEWIDVNKELPPMDEEVIVLTDILVENSMSIGLGKIAFGHIVDKDRCIDYNGWNIPGVRYWIPCPPIPAPEEKKKRIAQWRAERKAEIERKKQ